MDANVEPVIGREVKILDPAHPHAGEVGIVTDFIQTTGQWVVNVAETCPHGMQSAAAMPNQLQFTQSTGKFLAAVAPAEPDSKGLGGRPPKLTDEEKQELLAEYAEYIKTTDDPTIAEFVSTNDYCWEHNVLDHDMYHWKEFSQLTKRAQLKQEAYLLKQAGAGKYNSPLAIFRLKQPIHGYKDKVETDITSKGEKISMTDTQAEQLLRLRAKRAA